MSQSRRTYLVITRSGNFEITGHGFAWSEPTERLVLSDAEANEIAVFSAGSEVVGIIDQDARNRVPLVDASTGRLLSASQRAMLGAKMVTARRGGYRKPRQRR
jgi:hypothetical protein